MTDDEKIKAATAKLLGEFYVGQQVKSQSFTGTVERIERRGDVTYWIHVRFMNDNMGFYRPSELTPL
jgi:hypothetical protein